MEEGRRHLDGEMEGDGAVGGDVPMKGTVSGHGVAVSAGGLGCAWKGLLTLTPSLAPTLTLTLSSCAWKGLRM